jgi:cation diffusion facilitator family transporter
MTAQKNAGAQSSYDRRAGSDAVSGCCVCTRVSRDTILLTVMARSRRTKVVQLDQARAGRKRSPGPVQSPRAVVYVALACNAAIACAKYGAALLSGSAAMVAEGIHSTIDIGNQILLLYGLRRARRPPDEQFPFGYGKEIYFWSFVVAIEIFAVGAGAAILRGVLQLREPQDLLHPWINYSVLALALAFEGVSWLYAISSFSRTKGRRGYIQAVRSGKDPSRFLVLLEDSAALLGILIAAAGIGLEQLTGRTEFDAAASILIGVVLALTACWLAYETKGLLIGESASRSVVADIRRIAKSVPGIRAVHEILTMHVGPQFILVAITLEFSHAGGREQAIDRLEDALTAAHPHIQRIFVRVERRAAAAGHEI